MSYENPSVVVIGGGTGTKAILHGLRDAAVDVTAIINMADNGGSSGQLRTEFGILPPGDIRQAVAALSTADSDEIAAFEYRFTSDESEQLAGHPRGNLELASLACEGGFDYAVEQVSRRLHVVGRVLPVTLDLHDLHARVDGREVIGEHEVGQTPMVDRPELWLAPEPAATDEVVESIERVDMIVVAAGDLYGSLAPTFLVKGMAKALANRRGPVAVVTNLINKPHQTAGFTAADYVHEIERFVDMPCVDVLIQNVGRVGGEWLERHAHPGEELVAPVGQLEGKRVVGVDMIDRDLEPDRATSLVTKSYVRHDRRKVAATVMELLGV